MPQLPTRRTCKSKKSNGTPCLSQAIQGQDYCRHHHPNWRTSNPGHPAATAKQLEGLDLAPQNMQQLWELLAKTQALVLSGDLPATSATAIAACAREMLKSKPEERGVSKMTDAELEALAGGAVD